MTEKDPPFKIKYHDEKIRINLVENEEYYSSFLPETIHTLCLEEGSYVDLEKVTPTDEPSYIRAEKVPQEEVDTRIHYKIQKYGSRYYVTIPKRWHSLLIENPRKQLLEVEINFLEDQPHFRIYSLRDYYKKRLPELEDQGYDPDPGEPIALPLASLIWMKTVGKITGQTPEHSPPESQQTGNKSLREGFGDDIDDEPP